MNRIFFFKTMKLKMTTGFLVRNVLGKWKIELKHILRIKVCKFF
jgi:hypothetical protein